MLSAFPQSLPVLREHSVKQVSSVLSGSHDGNQAMKPLPESQQEGNPELGTMAEHPDDSVMTCWVIPGNGFVGCDSFPQTLVHRDCLPAMNESESLLALGHPPGVHTTASFSANLLPDTRPVGGT